MTWRTVGNIGCGNEAGRKPPPLVLGSLPALVVAQMVGLHMALPRNLVFGYVSVFGLVDFS